MLSHGLGLYNSTHSLFSGGSQSSLMLYMEFTLVVEVRFISVGGGEGNISLIITSCEKEIRGQNDSR